MAKFSSRHNSGIGDVNAMVNFIFLLQAAQDGNGGFYAGFTDQNLLKAPFKCGIFFNVLSVFIQRGGTHAMQLTTRQGRFQHVASIHCAFSLASTHHGVQLINEHNGLTFIFGQLIEH